VEEEPLSRSDEEGFHPHPGDPWHPEWEGGVDDDDTADPFAPPIPEEPAAPAEKRRLFGRRKPKKKPDPDAGDQAVDEGADLPAESAGWGAAMEDEVIAADLESVAADDFPAWTDEGESSVDFESVFTVGGDVGTGETSAAEPADLPDLPAPPEPSADDLVDEEPTESLDEIVLPDVGGDEALPEHGSGTEPEAPFVLDETPADLLDEITLLPTDDGHALPDEGSAPVIEIAAPTGLHDLTSAADEAAAALRSRASEVREEQAVERVAGEFDAVEVDAEVGEGMQDSLAAAGLDLPEPGSPPPDDPGFTPEETRGRGEPEDMADELEMVAAEDVDAALRSIAAEPVAASDADALDSLRAIGEDEDDDGWQAFADGESTDQADVPMPPPIIPAEDLLEDVGAPLEPPAGAEFDDLPEGLEGVTAVEEDSPKRGMFGRRKARKEAAAAGDMARGRPSADDDLPDTGEESADVADGQSLDTGVDEAYDEAGILEGEIEAGILEGEDWEEPIGEDEAADAFFAPDGPPRKRSLFGRRAARSEPEYQEADEEIAPSVDESGLAPPSLPVEEPLSEMPLLDEVGDGTDAVPPEAGLPLEPIGEVEEAEEEDSGWRGEGSRVPASWFSDIDEDEIDVPDIQPVDADEPASLLEAGGMLDVDDILDPVTPSVPEPEAPDEGGGSVVGLPVADATVGEEPADLFEPPGAAEPLDLLGAASALLPGESAPPSAPLAWEETGETDVPVPSSPATDHPVEAEWDDEPAAAPAPPLDPDGTVYDVVEDDIDAAPTGGFRDPLVPAAPTEEWKETPAPGPVDWTEDIYSGAVTVEHRGLADAVARSGTEETELQALSAAMPGLESGVVGFEDVEDLGSDEAYIPPSRSDLGARVLTGLILVSLLLGSLWVSGGALAIFVGVAVLIGLTEYFTTLRHRGYTPLALFGLLGAVGALAGTWFWGPIAVPGAILITTVVVFFFYAFAPRRRDALANGAMTVMGMAWIAGTVAFAMPIIGSEDYRVLVLAFVAATVAMDVGAYGFGRAWGSVQMAPVLSPNKSIEGLAGGVLLSIGVAIGIGYLMDPFDIQAGAALGLVVAVAAPLGDLAESMFKRSLGVKDMGAILPGHGGIMDRVDAFLFVIPPVWVLYEFLGYLT
jgi:phosphatidate cytidylyltransferase